MNIRKPWIPAIIFLTALLLMAFIIPATADVIFDPEIHVKRDCADSEAQVTFQITIPGGTPVDALPGVIEKLLAFYRDLWTGEDPVIQKTLPAKDLPALDEIVFSSKALSGVGAIMSTIRAFRKVEEQGFTAFPQTITVVSSETLPVKEECLLDSGPKTAARSSQNVEKRIPSYRSKNIAEIRKLQMSANLNNIAVSLVSFRSQFGRFPINLQEVVSSGHLLIIPVNPFQGKTLTFRSETGPGTFIYTKPSEERYILTGFDSDNLPMRRELLTRPDVPVRGLLSESKPAQKDAKPFTPKEQTVRIYIFQISQLLNSFYETYDYFPHSISHMDAQGFAHVNFANPFTGKPIQPSRNIDKGSPGSYFFMLVGESGYVISGFGEGGRKVIDIHRQFVVNQD